MARDIDRGIPALYKYQHVRYFPFEVEPGCSMVLTADPWSYLSGWLSPRIRKSRGRNRRCLRRAHYYAQLAAGFYESAASAHLPVKGTLAYYGMLNLVKCFLSVRGVELGTSAEYHGLSLPAAGRFEIQVAPQGSNSTSVFAEFARLCGKPVTTKDTLTFREVCAHVPEVHEIAFTLGLLTQNKKHLLPVEVDFLVNESKQWLFTEISYEKKEETRVATDKFVRGARESYFKAVGETDGRVRFRSKSRRRINNQNWPRIYRIISKEYASFDMASLLTRAGYRYYCNVTPGKYPPLCYPLMAMFYIGTASRYRPLEMEEGLEGELRPLLAEITANSPRQFLYQMVSMTTKSVCLVPHAQLV